MNANESIFQTTKHPFTLIVYGASGSLAKLKLFPALYELFLEKRLVHEVKIVGYARTPMSDQDFRSFMKEAIEAQIKDPDEESLAALLKNVYYVSGQYDQVADFERLKSRLEILEESPKRIRLSYFSVPPTATPGICEAMSKVDLGTSLSAVRLILEKPFGTDLKSAQKLKRQLSKHFKPEQIYLLDHYLGKEAVSNLLSLRYANSILSTLLSRAHVSHIQITAMEEKDIEGRANYFDQVGILRDMVQSHLLQVLAYLTMRAPKTESSAAIHHEKAKVLRALKIENLEEDVVRGQYEDYRSEKGIPENSQTETYAAIKLVLNHAPWKNVPVYIRTGKALKQKWTAVVIEFKPKAAQKKIGVKPNRLVIQLQPFEKIEFQLLTKLGGKTFEFHELTTGRPIYCSGDCLTEHGRLLLDAVAGKQGLFLNFEEIFAAWKIIDPIQISCEENKKNNRCLSPYPKGSEGPKAADTLIEKNGFEWVTLTQNRS